MKKLIIVSNRLPIDLNIQNELAPGTGGLVTAITGIEMPYQLNWVGAAPQKVEPLAFIHALKEMDLSLPCKYHPIFLSGKKYDEYYNGFCNDVLWPLLHYETSFVKFDHANWQSYVDVNRKFAREIISVAKTDDVIWIHDFHLFILPHFLKMLRPKLKVGFFLHVPFPSSEIFRQLPVAEEILQAVLMADLIGFHDYSYLRHFASTVQVCLGVESSLLSIEYKSRQTKLGVYPASIDTKKFMAIAQSPATQEILAQQQLVTGEQLQVILGVDRLDYIKGMELKLQAFSILLQRHPELHGKVQLLQIAIPSRVEVQEYINLKREIDRLVGEINGRFGTTNYVPIKYLFSSVSAEELSALYQLADVMFITSKRDGMNLVAIEYVVTQNEDNPGVLVLSEFAGATSTLFASLVINPWDLRKTADTLAKALALGDEEKIQRNSAMKKYFLQYDATAWAQRFVADLNSHATATFHTDNLVYFKRLPATISRRLQRARKMILLLDFDGTLAPLAATPFTAFLPPATALLLQELQANPKVQIAIISGRDRQFLQRIFTERNIHLGAEHGVFCLPPHGEQWQILATGPQKEWYPAALRVVTDFERRVPNSFVEQKEYSIAWHYRNSPADFARYQARKLSLELEKMMSNHPTVVASGKKIVEIKDISANKGAYVRWLLAEEQVTATDVIIALGDDATDEDMFKALLDNKNGITIKVGAEDTAAKYRLLQQSAVHEFLQAIKIYLAPVTPK